MNKALSLALLVTLTLAAASITEAQPARKIPRIGHLSVASPTDVADRRKGFSGGLRELGYEEGKTILIEYRNAEGKFDRLSSLVAELVRLKVDVIVSTGPLPTRAAKDATSTIPIVMTNDSDPVGSGFIASLARPGGNITGLSSQAHDLSAKRLEILKETVTKLARVAVFGSSLIPGNAQSLKEIELAATALGVQVQYIDLKEPKEIARAFQKARKARADAVLVLNGPPHIARQIPGQATKTRIPAIYFDSAIVTSGGLMSYGTSIADLDRRAAAYVDKILKGAKPADLPVEQPIKFEFVVNLKAAKQIGLTIPPNVLVRADRVIR